MNLEKSGSTYKVVRYQAGHIYTSKHSWMLSHEVHASRNFMETLYLRTVGGRMGEEKREVSDGLLLHIYSFLSVRVHPKGH